MPSAAPFPLVNLARAFLAGAWTKNDLLDRGKRACPEQHRWVRRTVGRLVNTFGASAAPSCDQLLAFLVAETAPANGPANWRVGEWFWLPGTMDPRGAAAKGWEVPALTSPGQLAEWLGITPGRLDWLADVHGWTVRQPNPPLRHYVCRWQARRRGRVRLIESPKPKLKAVQRKILHEILARIPPHSAAHGFLPGRSIVSFAAPHAGRRVVLRFDLRDFFPTVRPSRVHALFRTAGYPGEVARLLTGLCTSRMPADVWAQRTDPRGSDAGLGERLRSPHLPQGAPTSPALANLCAYRLDVRLHGLAGSLQAAYTRYADDLAFSGGEMLARSARRFQVAVAVIVAEEGFDLHFQKSRFMHRGVCQQLAGIVVNEHPNVRRQVYDTLKAIVTNCIHHGPQTQNRAAHADFRGHLLGRIAYVQMIHPGRGAKLRALFEQIRW